MSSCRNCQTVMQLMRNEIEELTEKEVNYKRINDALMEALSRNSPPEEKHNEWKMKYEAELQHSFELEKLVAELNNRLKMVNIQAEELRREDRREVFAERLVETSRNNYNYSQHEYHQQGAASTFRESSFTGRGNKLSWSKEMDYFTNHNSREIMSSMGNHGKENNRGSVRRMDNLMQTILMKKNTQGDHEKRKKLSIARVGKNAEVVVRIVNDRHRMYFE